MEEKRHVHAYAIITYGMDALRSEEPWKEWEFKGPLTEGWEDLIMHSLWDPRCSYRHKNKDYISKGTGK